MGNTSSNSAGSDNTQNNSEGSEESPQHTWHQQQVDKVSQQREQTWDALDQHYCKNSHVQRDAWNSLWQNSNYGYVSNEKPTGEGPVSAFIQGATQGMQGRTNPAVCNELVNLKNPQFNPENSENNAPNKGGSR